MSKAVPETGPAAVLVFGDGHREAVLLHAQDGGEAYMGPLLRKAVQYAKTHYDCGNMTDVLMSEGEMRKLGIGEDAVEECRLLDVRHVYYVGYRWDADTCRKTYRVGAVHLGRCAGAAELPVHLDKTGVPRGARRLV